MEDRRNKGRRSRVSANWLAVLGGCALSITIICALVLAVLLVASTAFNVYLAWSLSGYEISVSKPASPPGALVLVTPSGVLAIMPTPGAAPTSAPLPAATAGPTSAPTSLATAEPTSPPSPTAIPSTPEAKSASPAVTATQVEVSGGVGTEGADASESSPLAVAVGTSQTASIPVLETIPYVVQQGDTLWLIADTAYAAGPLWPVIFEANREILDDPNRIQPGQVLRLPLNP